jgi:RNA polymerase sigma factor (sigma-70 family)
MNRQQLVYKIIDQHYAENYNSMVKRARNKVGEFWCEDTVQDTYERAYRYWERLPIDFVGINSYLQIMLNNRIRDYQNNRIDSVELEEAHWESGELADEMRAKGILEEVLAFLQALPEKARQCVYLVLIQGENTQTVSGVLDMPQRTVQHHCQMFQQEVKKRYA